MRVRVLSVASECVPLVKTGGLADVAGALPAALAACDVEMRTLLPGYRGVLAGLGDAPSVSDLGTLFGGPAHLREARLGAQSLLVLDAPHLFDRDGGPYAGPDGRDWPDNPERFAALSMAAARIAAGGADDWRPDILHLHDWQAGLAPVYLAQLGAAERVGTLLTIHNVAFQGLAPADAVARLGLPRAGFTSAGFEFWGQISALKAGIVWSDRISTVSPTYARELLRPEFGHGLDGVLADRRADLTGILNGIDTDLWAPPFQTPRGKVKHRRALRDVLQLPDASGPLCVLVSRLTRQKGLDLLLEALPELLERGGQLAVLGTGEPALEAEIAGLAARHADVAATIGYDEDLARKLIAGGDAILVPSRFEPCGLTQLYGLRMGTIPVVSLTGGLADTVINASPAALSAGVATGLQVHPVTGAALADALGLLSVLYARPEIWSKMQRNAMAQPVGWDVSAAAYAEMYRDIVTAG